MALFKPFYGTSSNLPTTLTIGRLYVTTDDGKVYIDVKTDEGTKRICINQDIDWNNINGGVIKIKNPPSVASIPELDITYTDSTETLRIGNLSNVNGENGDHYDNTTKTLTIGVNMLVEETDIVTYGSDYADSTCQSILGE